MAEATLFVLVQIPFGVDVDSVDNDADMQMISGHIAGSADFGNGVVFVHRIANLSQKLAAMGVKGAIPAAVVDDEIISITDMVAGLYDRTGFHCQNWCAIGIGNVQTIMVGGILTWNADMGKQSFCRRFFFGKEATKLLFGQTGVQRDVMQHFSGFPLIDRCAVFQ